jgi:hypothetical protein
MTDLRVGLDGNNKVRVVGIMNEKETAGLLTL